MDHALAWTKPWVQRPSVTVGIPTGVERQGECIPVDGVLVEVVLGS